MGYRAKKKCRAKDVNPFRVLRLPYGVSLAPSAFQRVIDGLAGGLDGAAANQYNICVTA